MPSHVFGAQAEEPASRAIFFFAAAVIFYYVSLSLSLSLVDQTFGKC
jgi:hypothetical protein